MLPLNSARMKRITAIHGWAGATLGPLLYILVVTGTIAVFAPQIGRWSAGNVRDAPPLHGPIHETALRLAAQVDPSHLNELRLWAGEGPDLFVFFHTDAINPGNGRQDELGTLLRVDSVTGTVIERHEGFIWDKAEAWEPSALRRFFIALHVRLMLPDPWGYIATGILGLMLIASVISGALMHRHLWRDLFLGERPGGRLASVRDRHVLAGSWLLPFALLLALTGTALSFGGTLILPLVESVAGPEALAAVPAPGPAGSDPRPAPLADLDRMVSDSIGRAGSPVFSVSVTNLGRTDCMVTVWHHPTRGELVNVAHLFDGARGAFLWRQAPVGTAFPIGGTLYSVMEPLHFGSFLGLASQLVWGALGATMAFMILSGLRLWVRRRSATPSWRRFGHAVLVLGYGLPLSMVTAALAFFPARAAHDPFLWTPVGFSAGVATCLALGLRLPPGRTVPILAHLLALGCLALPLLRIATGGVSWTQALGAGAFDIPSVDVALIIAGGLLWRHARTPGLAPLPEPAE